MIPNCAPSSGVRIKKHKGEKNMKKTLSAVLALCLLLTCVSITALAEDDWITLRVEVFDRSTAGLNLEDCMQLRYIQENFGNPNHINVKFVPISRWSETEILNTQLAGGTAPDVCMTYDSALVQNFIDMGGLYPMDDLLANYGQNLTKFLGESVLQFGRKGDPGAETQWYVCARRISVARSGGLIRGDWLEKLNMANPTTIDEWVNYLYAAKEANLGGEQTVPFVLKSVPEAPIFSIDLLIDAMIDWDKVTKEQYYSQYKVQLPGAKEAFRLLNKLYNDGLMNETFAIDNGDIRDLAMNQGYAGYYIESPIQVFGVNAGYQYELTQNVPDGYWVASNCFKDKFDRTLHEVYDANGMCIFIPSWVSEETAVAAMKYLDWISIFENRFFLTFGVEGINYKSVSEEGFPMERQGNAVDDEYKMSGDVLCISNGVSFDDPELDAKYQSIAYPGYEERVAEALSLANTDIYRPISFTVTIQSEADYGLTIKTKLAELLAKSVTCPPADFDAAYDNGVAEILSAGGAEIVAEKLAAYQAGAYRGDYPGLAE